MTLYVDTSALVKLYIAETDTAVAETVLAADADWVTGAHTEVEIRRTLAVRLRRAPALAAQARAAFDEDWQHIAVVALDAVTCRLAADLAGTTLARSLDALHLAAAQRAGAPALTFVTYDIRLAQVARSMGWAVQGAWGGGGVHHRIRAAVGRAEPCEQVCRVALSTSPTATP